MSDQMKWEMKIGIVTIIFTFLGSMLATTWYAADRLGTIEEQIRHNRKDIENIDHRIVEMSKVIMSYQGGK